MPAEATRGLLLAALLLAPWLLLAESERERIIAMDQSYAELERERTALQRRLDYLRDRINRHGLRRPEGIKAVEAVGKGYSLLRSPPLRAAFVSVEEIDLHRGELAAVQQRLDWVESLLPATEPAP